VENKLEKVQLKNIAKVSTRNLEPIHHQVTWDSKKIYCIALNEKSAAKKIAHIINQLLIKK
jgi:hypothetical protein